MVGGMKRREVLQVASIGCLVGLSGCQGTSDDSEPTTSNPTQPGGSRTQAEVNTQSGPDTPTAQTDASDRAETDTETPTETETEEPTEAPEVTEVRVQHRGNEIEVVNTGNQETLFSSGDAAVSLQTAIDRIDGEGIVILEAGTYVVDRPVLMRSDTSLIGPGSRKPVLKLADGLNQQAVSVLRVGVGVSDVTIRNIEIDGNESNNRQIEPFPDSPPSHGLIIHGDGVGDKPENVTVDNIYSHDAIRSNVVLGGGDCTPEDLELENAATDHWLYLARAERCEVSNVSASGFARGSGITFGTPGYQCSQNTVSDVVVSDAAKPPHATLEPNGKVSNDWPRLACDFRPDGDGYGNTLRNVRIEPPTDDFSQRVLVAQPDSILEGLDFTGPVGYTWNVLQLGVPADGADVSGTVVDSVTFDITDNIGFRANPYVIASVGSDVTVTNGEINAGGHDHPGVFISGMGRPIENNVFRDLTVRTDDPAVIADGTENPVTGLSITDFRDVNESGTEIRGDVTFSERDISS
jgi:hypothetical protein